MAYVKRTLNQVLEAIKDSGGVKFVVARRLGVERSTLDRYLERWPKALAALTAEDEDTGDMAESVIKRNIELALKTQIEKKAEADSGDAWRWLRSRRRERFSERQEISQEHAGEIVFRVIRE